MKIILQMHILFYAYLTPRGRYIIQKVGVY